MSNPVVEWLESDEGRAWSRRHHRLANNHALIELSPDDRFSGVWIPSAEKLRKFQKSWGVGPWTPDVPPEGGVPVREVRDAESCGG